MRLRDDIKKLQGYREEGISSLVGKTVTSITLQCILLYTYSRGLERACNV